MPTCPNCLALELRIERLEADEANEDADSDRIADLEARLARTERKLARSQALCRRLATSAATLGGLLSGRLTLRDVLGAA